ncbi:MAG TPA: cation diffusion facilitator family transporter [Myxococcota bacterium]|nr:cation diffusion facilitator family transporter [Myxococcota bacterium]
MKQRRKAAVAKLSIFSNTFLVVAKAVVGLTIGSVAVLSEAIHSGIDLIASSITYIAVRKSGEPADISHPYGHGKIEDISGMLEALLIFIAAGWIIYQAIGKLLHPQPLILAWWGIGVMGTSSIVNLFVSRRLFRVGKETDSVALMADGWHLRTDVYTSAGVMLGLLLIAFGGVLSPGRDLSWLDPAVAMAVALLIMRAAWHLTRKSVEELLDSALPATEQEKINEYFRGQRTRVLSFHRLRTRKAGPARFIDIHIVLDPDMTVAESHKLSHHIADDIRKLFTDASTSIHVEPCDGRCKSECLENCSDSNRQKTGT